MNIITLVSGTAFSQGILLAATPVLTRLYSPDNFGVLAIYLSIVGTIALISSWKYELAIMLPNKDDDAKALVVLSLLITFITTIISFLLIVLFKKYISIITQHYNIFVWIVPMGILLGGVLQIHVSWGNRQEKYKEISISRINKSFVTIFIQIAFGFLNLLKTGLIYGNLLGTFSSLFYLIYKNYKNLYYKINRISQNQISNNFSKYKNFPKYQSISVFINSLSQHLPIILLSLFYSPAVAGFYSLTHRVLATPAKLIGNSVRQVYYQRASKEFNNNKSLFSIFIKSTTGLIKISIIPFILVSIFAKPLFIFLFGEKWLISGIYAQLLSFYVMALTVNPPTIMTLQVLSKQKFGMVYEIILAFFRFVALFIGFIVFNNHFISIGLFSATGILFNLFLIIYIFITLKNDFNNRIELNG